MSIRTDDIAKKHVLKATTYTHTHTHIDLDSLAKGNVPSIDRVHVDAFDLCSVVVYSVAWRLEAPDIPQLLEHRKSGTSGLWDKFVNSTARQKHMRGFCLAICIKSRARHPCPRSS